jgi:hypothetical protein
VTALDLFLSAFHLSGLVVLGALYWRFRDRLRANPWPAAADEGGGGDGGGSDRAALQPDRPWSWRRRPRPGGGGRATARRRRTPAAR